MPAYDQREVDEAFQHWWNVGNIQEDWLSWTELFTPDAVYVEHFWGTFVGRDQIRVFIESVMKGVPEMYTVLEWYVVGPDRVCYYLQNRRDNPGTEGPAYFDFPELSTLWYAGGGQWSKEEAFWSVNGARTSSVMFDDAVRRAGPGTGGRPTRSHWPDGPAWARTDASPLPSWDRDDVVPVRRPSELRAVMAASGMGGDVLLGRPGNRPSR
jgi:hypothetical protein